MVNPKSFTQTAENILALSFQIKKGAVTVGKSKGYDLPVVSMKPQGGEDSMMPSKQSVISLNMAQWRNLVKEFNVKQGEGVPPRGGKSGNKSKAGTF